MDWSHPLTSRLMMFWEDAAIVPGHLLGGHVRSEHLDSVRRDGHLTGTHLLDNQGYPAGTTVFESAPHVFGRFRYAVVTEDVYGNRQTSGVQIDEFVINDDPPAASELRPMDRDVQTGQFTFSFRPSAKLVG